MKYYHIILIFVVILFTGCLDANNSPGCNSVDKTFLEQNAAREGVKETDSGLQYRVIKEAEGNSPELTDRVRVKYKGSLTSGDTFDETIGNNTAVFDVNRLIPGFTEGLLLMTVGSTYELVIPPNLAYGCQPPNPVIPQNAILVFEVELVGIL